MPKRTFRLREGEPLLDLVSMARGGPNERFPRLTPEQIDHIRRTVNRAPEAVVKVLPRASNDLNAVAKHLDYIGRKGELDLETDDGQRLQGRARKALLEDWDLDIDEARRQASLAATRGRKAPKIVHKLMFSMPPGTPPKKVLKAVRNFAREEFGLQHRYAFVLHTDEPHPHVHLVLKAMSEQGVRLNIKKATLRHWRSEFARNLRLIGVAANATERAVRGETRKADKDAIYRAALRGYSSHRRSRSESIAKEILAGRLIPEPGKRTLLKTRDEVKASWGIVAERLTREGQLGFVKQVKGFVDQMPPVVTERERIAGYLLGRLRVTRHYEQLRGR